MSYINQLSNNVFVYGVGMELSPLLLRPIIGLFCQLWMIDNGDCKAISGLNK
jgi:hypothetical protein